jgi:GH15 family glucan-1,4-alpha-glucosidase
VNSREKHKREVKDPNDLRYGLIEPGGMEVLEVGKGMHMYYMNAFGILGLREAAEAAQSLGRAEDAKLFTAQAGELAASLHKSFAATFKRTGLYDGKLHPARRAGSRAGLLLRVRGQSRRHL